MTQVQIDTDILIVGAGPVGLFLANECARRGLRYRIVELNSKQSEHSKALAVMPRTLEIFDMAGVAGEFLETANRVTWIAVMDSSRTLARMRFAPDESPYPFVAMVPQDVTERILVNRLTDRGGAVEYETRFVSAVQHGGHVRATLEHHGELRQVTAAFLVGCDGAHSAVRHLLDLSFEGGSYDAAFMLADVDTNETLPAGEMQLCPGESGPLAIFPMNSTRRRIVATIDKQAGETPSLEVIRSVLAKRGPAGFEARGVRWSGYFRVHHRHVSQLRVGRAFVAGDAAHIHSPIGGQGMNTGLHDAWNLVWKLDLVLRGRGGERLLNSYTAERLPVIRSVVGMTDFMTRALGSPNKFVQTLREAVLPVVSRIAPVQDAIVQRLSQVGITYGGSPIVEGAGKRYFEDSVRGGNGICSRLLLLTGVDPPALDDARRFCSDFSELVELRSKPGYPGMALIRPDGYIAVQTEDAHSRSFLDCMRSLLRELHE